ncbi:MAG: hypothetical protein ACLU5I_01580 [Alistipes finegoldii]
MAVWGASSLWSIGELFSSATCSEGWFPANRTGRRNNPAVAPACRRAGLNGSRRARICGQ